MNKLLIYFISIAALIILCSTCTVQLNSLNQKAVKKCSVCKKFLHDEQIFDVYMGEYNRTTSRGYTERIDPKGTFLQGYKTLFMDSKLNSYLHNHKFCFTGMKKADVESRFGKQLDKVSYEESGVNNLDWGTAYSYNIGTVNEDSSVVVEFAQGIHFYYQIIEEDTLFLAFPAEKHSLKKCLEEDGVKYKE